MPRPLQELADIIRAAGQRLIDRRSGRSPPMVSRPSRRAWRPRSAAGRKRWRAPASIRCRRITTSGASARKTTGIRSGCWKVFGTTMPAYERRLKDLETWLGEDHNLVVLQEKVMAEPGFYGRQPEIALFVKLIGKYHKELRGNALALGARIYDEKPRQFTRRMRRMWDAGQAQKATPGP